MRCGVKIQWVDQTYERCIRETVFGDQYMCTRNTVSGGY